MKHLNSESGQVTPEFLFSLVVAFGLFMLFLAISFTLSVVEVGQYIAYSTARAQVGSNLDPDAQRTAATNKYAALGANSAFKFIFQNGWFTFGTPDIRQGGGDDFREKLGDGGSGQGQYEKVFTGVSVAFSSKILNIQIPFLRPGRDDEQGFTTYINAILIREPSQQECTTYWTQRGQALTTLPSGTTSFYTPASYVAMEDNGC